MNSIEQKTDRRMIYAHSTNTVSFVNAQKLLQTTLTVNSNRATRIRCVMAQKSFILLGWKMEEHQQHTTLIQTLKLIHRRTAAPFGNTHSHISHPSQSTYIHPSIHTYTHAHKHARTKLENKIWKVSREFNSSPKNFIYITLMGMKHAERRKSTNINRARIGILLPYHPLSLYVIFFFSLFLFLFTRSPNINRTLLRCFLRWE